MDTMEFWEFTSYVVTALGLPFGIFAFLHQSYKERELEMEELYQSLSEEYAKFGQLLIANADLQLMTGTHEPAPLTPEQAERKKIIYDLLVGLFERAFILVYEPKMDKQTARLWATWEDYIRFWCRRDDFRAVLPELLMGEDPDFSAHIARVAGISLASHPA